MASVYFWMWTIARPQIELKATLLARLTVFPEVMTKIRVGASTEVAVAAIVVERKSEKCHGKHLCYVSARNIAKGISSLYVHNLIRFVQNNK
jgi:hypothetical protein